MLRSGVTQERLSSSPGLCFMHRHLSTKGINLASVARHNGINRDITGEREQQPGLSRPPLRAPYLTLCRELLKTIIVGPQEREQCVQDAGEGLSLRSRFASASARTGTLPWGWQALLFGDRCGHLPHSHAYRRLRHHPEHLRRIVLGCITWEAKRKHNPFHVSDE